MSKSLDSTLPIYHLGKDLTKLTNLAATHELFLHELSSSENEEKTIEASVEILPCSTEKSKFIEPKS